MTTTKAASEADPEQVPCTAFEGSTWIASGDLESVAVASKAVVDRGGTLPVRIFDNTTGTPIDVDFRDSVEDLLLRLRLEADFSARAARSASPKEVPRGPGRPRLGVVAREVTLLPCHWNWLNEQPGGASAALRRLIDETGRAKVINPDQRRRAQESAYRFMSAMAGGEAGFTEAAQAIFAADRARFDAHTVTWPRDVRDHAAMLAFRDPA